MLISVRLGDRHTEGVTTRFCKTPMVIVMSDVGSGHYDHQTSRHLTSFCGDFLKKEFTSKAPINLEECQLTVAGIGQESLPKCAGNAVETVNIGLQ